MTTPGSGGPAGCPTCGRPNRDGARFCAGCGGSLAPRCAACGAELDADARFCDTCGAPVGSPSPASSTSGARKVVTVAFADLAGSTALAERMDPESVRAVMQRYYALIREVVERSDGRIVKFIGDGVMAVFGVPETREDDTLNALHAALAMHDAFAPLAADVARERGATIGLRVGVNTGEVVVGGDDDDVVGDAVNLAARLERAAQTGGVLVGESTWRLTRGTATFGRELVLHVAGKSEAVRAWPLVAMAREVVELRTDLVGRARELAVLRRVFADAVATASPRLVTIVGSPGVGKTRLASELERLVDGANVLVVRCTQQAGAPLAPIAEMLHAAVGGRAADAEETVERLGALLGDDGDRDRVLQTVAAVLGRGAGATPEETFWALRRLVEQRARTQPTVLVVDDLQWGEAILIDLVEHLAEWTRGSLLLVVTARPELREIRSALTDGTRHTVVALEGLDGDATGELACELLGADSLPRELLERLPASTGGNPLFLRELLRMLVDDGVLRADADGGWALGVAPHAIDVPPTIQSLLAARLDRLSPDEQLVLERAAIWGTEFPLGALIELLPPTIAPRVQPVLEQLRRKELLETVSSYWIDEPMHRFHHVLIRDAAYRRILRDVRASLHEQLAAWVDAKTASLGGVYDQLVGHHLEQSYRQRCELGPPDDDTSALGRTAAARLGAAAQRALDRDDPSAASLSGRALACLPPDDTTRADLLLIRCDALLSAADAVSAREAVAELERIAVTSPRLRAWSACFAAQLATITDPAHLRETEQRAAAVAAELTELGDARGAAKAHAVHAGALARLGRFAEVEDALDRALTRAREADDRRLATAALAAAPVAAVWGPSPVPRAGGRCLDVVRLLRITAGSPVVEATSLRCQAVLESFRGRTDAARRLVGTARDSLLELGLVHGLLEAELFAGIVELGAGDLAAADKALQRAYDGLRGLGADADAARAGALLARVALERGALADAERLAREAEQLAGDDLQAGISWRGVAAEVLARRGEHEAARVLAEAAVAIAAQTDALVHHADACMALAAVRRAAGDGDGAAQAAREAADLYERKGATALVAIARGAFDGPAREPAALATPAQFLHNRCREVLDAWRAAFARGDRDALERRGPHLEMLRDFANLGVREFVPTVRAVRGDRIVLAEFSAGGAIENVMHAGQAWAVVALADDDTIGSFTIFDDVAAAVDELERRHIAGDGAPFAEMLELIANSTRAYNARDWDALRATYAPAIDYVDNSTAGWASFSGGHDMSEFAAENTTDVSDAFATVQVIHACTAHAAVATTLLAGSVADRGTIERSGHLVYHRNGAAMDRVEIFDEDDLDRALAAYRRLVPRDVQLSNRCTDVLTRWTELYAERDFTAMRSVAVDDFVLDDRRRVITTHEAGPEVQVHMQLLRDEIDELAVRTIAVRGESLALIRTEGRGREPGTELFTYPTLGVTELAGDGRLASFTAFDPDDLDAAVAELDRRFIAGEGAIGAAALELLIRGNDAYNAGDWAAMAECYAPDVVWVDRVSGGWASRRGRDAVFAVLRQLAEGRSIMRAVPACSAHAVVYTITVGAIDDLELALTILMRRSGDQVSRMEVFGADELDAALAAFDAIDERREPANQATDVLFRWAELFAARQLDAMRDLVVDDFVLDDRRPIVGAVEHARDAGLSMRLLAEHADRLDIRVLAVRGSRLALAAAHGQSDEPGAELFAAQTLSVVELTDEGRLASFTAFDLDDLDAAVGELEQRYMEGEGAPHAGLWSIVAANIRATNARDWPALRSGLAPGFVSVNDQARGWDDYDERDEYIRSIAQMTELLPDARIVITAIRAIDATKVLCSLIVSNGATVDRAEIAYQCVFRLDGRAFDLSRTFGADAFDEAMEAYHQLERPADERAPGRPVVRAMSRMHAAYNARDWEALRACCAPDVALVDHRPASWGAMGLDGIVDTLQHLFVPDARMTLRKIHEATPGALLGLVVTSGHDAGGAAVESSCLVVAQLTADGIARMETFAVEALDHARERYHELSSAVRPSYVVENRCTTAGDRLCELFVRRDWEAFGARFAPGFDGDDYRHGFTSFDADPVKSFGTVVELAGGAVDMELRPIAVRGDRLALSECWMVSEEEFALEPGLFLTEVDDDGRFVWVASYDVDARDLAFADLEQRFLAGEGARLAPTWSIVVAGHRAQNARDWDAFGAGFTRDVVSSGHYYGGWTDRVGREAYVEAVASLTDPFPETWSYPVEILAISDDAVAYLGSVIERGQPGDAMPFITLLHVTPAGVDRIETFSAAERAAALAAYERMQPENQLVNRCTRAQDRLCELFGRRDWNAFGARFAPNFDGDTHRRGDASFDSDPIRSFGAIAELGGDNVEMRLEPVALRGERLAVSEVRLLSSPFNEETYVLCEVDDEDRFAWIASYDGEDIDDAIADLDRRYVAGEAGPYREMLHAVVESMRAVNDRDWEALRRLFAPDIVDIDHYAAGWGTRVGIDGAIDAIQELLAAFPNPYNYMTAVPAVALYALVATTVVASRDAGGASAEMEFHVVYHRDARGRIDRMEVFPADALAAARARYAELARPRGDVVPPNRAFLTFERAMTMLVHGDVDGFAAVHAPDIRTDDRRLVAGTVVDGFAAMVTDMIVPPDGTELTLVATRGETLSLHRASYTGSTDEGFEWAFDVLFVVELDADDRIACTVLFDVDSVDTAYDELDRRYLEHLESTARGLAVVWHVASRWRDAFNARDWSAMRSVQSPDLVFVDHTAAGYGGADRTRLETIGSAFVDATPDVRMRFEHVEAISDRGVVVGGRTTASNAAGGEFESTAWNVLAVRAGAVRSIDVYPRDQLSAARARYTEVVDSG